MMASASACFGDDDDSKASDTPSETASKDQASATEEKPADAKPADAAVADAKPADAKPADEAAKTDEKADAPKDEAKAETKDAAPAGATWDVEKKGKDELIIKGAGQQASLKKAKKGNMTLAWGEQTYTIEKKKKKFTVNSKNSKAIFVAEKKKEIEFKFADGQYSIAKKGTEFKIKKGKDKFGVVKLKDGQIKAISEKGETVFSLKADKNVKLWPAAFLFEGLSDADRAALIALLALLD
jgi:hypothetical protein